MDSIVALRIHLARNHGVPAGTPRSERLITDARLLAAPNSAVAHPFRSAPCNRGELLGSFPSSRGSRRETRRGMESLGFITDFTKSGYGPLGTLFIQLIRGKLEDRIVYGIARALMQFTTWAARNTRCQDSWDALTDRTALIKYVHSLKAVLRPASVRNYVQFLHRFLRSVGTFNSLWVHVPPRVRPRTQDALRLLQGLWNEAERVQARFQKRRVLAGRFQLVNLLAVRTFIHDPSFIRDIQDHLSLLEVKGLYGNEIVWNALLASLVCLLTEQAPRLCALQAFRAREFNTARAVGGYTILRGEEHKTEDSFGDSVLVLKNYEFQYFLRYAQLRSKYFPNKIHFFLNSNGKVITPKVFAGLNAFLTSRGHRKVNLTDVRRTVTIIDRQFNHSRGETAVDSYLTHSRPVADKSYFYRTDSARLADYLATLHAEEQSYLVALAKQFLPKTALATFPCKERVFERLETKRVELGIVASEIKSTAWLIIRQDWRTAMFETLIRALQERVKHVKPSGFPVHAVKSVVQSLDPVWLSERNHIESCLYQNLL